MPKLNQVLAIEKGTKARTFASLTADHQLLAKPAPLSGITRVYSPKDLDGDQLPPESTLVQVIVTDILAKTATSMTELFDVVAMKEWANTHAAADVVVDGLVLLPNVPVTYLLFLEKQLVALHTFVAKLPTLDPAEEWELDANTGTWRTKPQTTTRSKKVPRNHVRAPATKEHPAQVDLWHEDVIVGTWTTTRFSGALPASRVAELLDRIVRLQAAVLVAREAANMVNADPVSAGTPIFSYLFA